MKRIFILSAFFFIIINFSFSQPWLELLPQDKSSSEITFYDYQNAFNEYWSEYQIDNGWYIDNNGQKQKAYGWKQFKRWEYFWQYRIDKKTGKFPSTTASYAFNDYISKKGNYSKNGGTWTCLGTSSTTGGYAGIGRINTVAFHPTNPDVYWIGAPAGGLWSTYDGGNSWTVHTDTNAVLGVSAIVIPSDFDVSQTIYIGTGDRDASDNYSVGVLKSTDAGSTWEQTGLVFEPQHLETVNNMRIHPENDNIIFAATSDGFYVTYDGANTWTQTYHIPFVDIELCHNKPDTIYGSTRYGHIYRTINGGDDWTQVFSSVGSRIELAVTADNEAAVYALVAAPDNGLHAICKSNDYGENFSVVFDDYNLLAWGNGGGAGGQAWYDLALAVDPNDENNLYIGGVNTWRSIDGGVNWNLANHWYGGFGVQDVHADKHYFAFRNNESVLFECNDGGIYSTNDGELWNHHTNGIVISQIYGLSTAQTIESMTIVGLQDNGTKLQDQSSWEDVLGGDGMLCKINPSDQFTQYGSFYYGQIYRTTDKWINGISISDNLPTPGTGNWVTPYEIDPIDHNTIYIGYSSLYKSTDMGDNFEAIGNFGSNLDRIAICETDNNYIYVTTGSSLSKTTNGGISWDNITSGLPISYGDISYIEVKYNDPNTVWVTISGYNEYGVYKTTNGGQDWTNISSGLPEIPVNCIIQNKLESTFEQIYIGTDFGVYLKEGDADWELFSQDLPNVVVSELDIYYEYGTPDNSRLRASTYGRGLWETPLQLSGNFAPFVNTNDAQNISTTSADLLGVINYDFASTVTESGFLISTISNPLIGGDDVYKIETNPVVVDGDFTINAIGLNPGTKYYYRAYAINANGVGYGSEKEVVTLCNSVTSFPWTSGCENNGDIPLCFSQELVLNTAFWNASESNLGYPNSPHSGDYFFLVKKDDDIAKTKLVLPIFDLSVLDEAKISFWLFNASVFFIEDTLTLWYKNDNVTEWELLATYDNPITEWTEFSVDLPDLTDNYQIAFQANVTSSRGVAIDDIVIDFGYLVNELEENIVISPVPSTGIVYVNFFDNNENYQIEVFDVNGKLIINKTSNLNTQIIDMSGYQNGVYFLKIKNSTEIITKKIIIRK